MEVTASTMKWSERRGLWAVAIVAVAVHLPAVGAPLMLDDYGQSAMVEGTFPIRKGPLDMYDFVDDASRAPLVERGVLPWWTHPRLTVRFLRPLSSALLWADYRATARRPVLAHVHSLAWWALASVAAYALMRRALGRRVALMGGAAFAFAPCHAIPLVWLANREALVCTALGAFALAAYARWREKGRPRDAAASSALFTLAMMGGEYALCFGGYVLAIDLVRRGDRLARRAVGVLAFALPATAYLGARSLLHYGAYGSGLYREPLRHIGPVLAGAPRRLVALFADGWLTIDADAFWLSAPAWTLGAIAVVSIALLHVPVKRAIAALDAERRQRAKWLLWGSLLSLAPLMAVQPSLRLIGTSAIGACAVVGVVLDFAWFPTEPHPRRGVAGFCAIVAVLLGFAHLVRSPVLTWLYMRAATGVEAAYDERIAWVRKNVADTPGKRIVVVRADAMQTMLFAPFRIDGERGVPPGRWWVLSYGSGRSLMLRTGPRAIELVASTPSPLFPIGLADVFRDESAPVRAGEVAALDGMRAEVLAADERGARRVRFEFDRDLEDGSLVWLAEGRDGFREQHPPREGYGTPVMP